ncbi:MAG TPA: Maf family protein [Syntrophales bacterium]|nr:Maf family protein [Syntrophales bacterium]HOX93281.1 Maf family protein [Syntrophales bacterium]HPI56245.1 Maf family protein [Syntrophales bacterium]HPN24432.1 Maf family protein [Syntrophales bacterium]HQM29062.1 Maf family protein [Syntrophales bacterium]
MQLAQLILASASPRREELLSLAGITFQVIPSEVVEGMVGDESPEAHVLRLAEAKAASVAGLYPDAWVLGADTVVVIDGEVLGKPARREEARVMMHKLSGRTHRVITGFTLLKSAEKARVRKAVTSTVTFREMTAEEVEWYIDTEEPYDKAGGYAVQGRAALFIRQISGSYTNVIGLPICEVVEALRDVGAVDFAAGERYVGRSE